MDFGHNSAFMENNMHKWKQTVTKPVPNVIKDNALNTYSHHSFNQPISSVVTMD